MSEIRPAESDSSFDGDDEPFVLDISPRGDFQADHIDGSHNLPLHHDLRAGDESAVYSVANATRRDTRRRRSRVELSAWRGYRTGFLGYRFRSMLTAVLARVAWLSNESVEKFERMLCRREATTIR